MAIASIYETGWEWQQAALEITALTHAINTANPRTGSRALGLNSSVSGGTYQEHSSSISQCRFAIPIRHDRTSGSYVLGGLRQGTTNILYVLWNATSSQWEIVCGATTVAAVSDVPFATQNVYHHIGVDLKIHASAGWCYLYRDGSQIVAFNGIANQGGSTFNRLHLGAFGGIGAAWTSGTIVDDIYWDDTTGESAPTAPPDYRLEFISPNGNGNYATWTGSDGNSTDNYLLVDELPHNSDTDYVVKTTAGKDSYAMTTVTLPAGWAIAEVIPMAVARKTDALGTLGLKLGTRESSTDSMGSTQALGTSYTLYKQRQATKPSGGNWSQASLDAVEVVVEASA